MLAATLAGPGGDPFARLPDARRLIDEASKEKEPDACPAELLESNSEIPRPPAFPASFDDFLRLIVGGRAEGEQLRRFRRYLAAPTADPLNPAETKAANPDEAIPKWRNVRFDLMRWEQEAERFRSWWERHMSSERSKAAKSRNDSKKGLDPD